MPWVRSHYRRSPRYYGTAIVPLAVAVVLIVLLIAIF